MTCGIDIVEISRMERLVLRHGASLGRFFTTEEMAYCAGRGRGKYASFAAIYAAKEAYWKACRTGFRQGRWTDVEVAHDELGAPYFVFYGKQAETMKDREYPALSLAHDGAYAIAQVVLP